MLSNDPFVFLLMVALSLGIVYLTYRMAIAVYIFYVMFVKKDDNDATP